METNGHFGHKKIQHCPLVTGYMQNREQLAHIFTKELKKIMNDIFNPYSKFFIVYIDDVLIFSQNTDQHFKHLQTFIHIVKQNGLAVSKSKINLFQTKI